MNFVFHNFSPGGTKELTSSLCNIYFELLVAEMNKVLEFLATITLHCANYLHV